MYEPLNYEAINAYEGTRAPTGTVINDFTTRYFFRCLYQRALSIIRFELPEDWNRNYFKNVLFGSGFIGVIDSPEYGVIPQICTMSGYGLYLQPRRILVSQPLVRFEGEIGKDCELVKLTPDYRGICDIVDHYAVQLSIAFTSLKSALLNSRLSYLAFAKNKQAAETLKVVLEKISSGDPAVVVNKMLRDEDMSGEEQIFSEAFDIGRNYIVDRLLEDMRGIINDFDREIGIPIIDDKKERRVIPEISMIVSDTGSRLDVWAECLQDSFDRVNRLFGLDLAFETITERTKVENEQYTEDNPDRAL